MRCKLLGWAGAVGIGIGVGVGSVHAEELELMHFWTSGGEAAAMNVVKQAAQGADIQWKDAAVAGGAGMNAYQVLQSRIASGNPPAAMQMHGEQIKQYAEGGLLLDLTDLATSKGWDKVIDPDLLSYARIDGRIVGIPFNMHRSNYIWGNKAIVDRYGGKMPATWDEFFLMADKMKADGVLPLASGGQPWQDLLLFEQVVLGGEGRDFYKAAIGEAKPEALNSPQMAHAFQTYRKVLSYTDQDRANRDWNLASAMVINGDAAFQLMGDWANGEFLKAGKVADKDYLCTPTPGTAGTFFWNADFWGFFRGLDANKVSAQQRLAEVTLDKTVQRDFNVLKGSSPSRTDVGTAGFSGCGLKSVSDREAALKSGGMIGSVSQNSGGQPPEVRGVFEDVVNQFGNDPSITPEAAVQKILQGLGSL